MIITEDPKENSTEQEELEKQENLKSMRYRDDQSKASSGIARSNAGKVDSNQKIFS